MCRHIRLCRHNRGVSFGKRRHRQFDLEYFCMEFSSHVSKKQARGADYSIVIFTNIITR